MADTAQVRLEVESRPENLALVRSVLAAFGGALAVDGELLEDIETAVSEACNQVVLYAYETHTGPLIVALTAAPEMIEARVEDHGEGIRPRSAESSIGIGLLVISALADRAEFRTNEGGGREVRLRWEPPWARNVSSGSAAPRGRPQREAAPRAPSA